MMSQTLYSTLGRNGAKNLGSLNNDLEYLTTTFRNEKVKIPKLDSLNKTELFGSQQRASVLFGEILDADKKSPRLL